MRNTREVKTWRFKRVRVQQKQNKSEEKRRELRVRVPSRVNVAGFTFQNEVRGKICGLLCVLRTTQLCICLHVRNVFNVAAERESPPSLRGTLGTNFDGTRHTEKNASP